ncbi:MAG: formate/nitrite transporter family protein [Hyphomicrobiaceae bacterium]|nr:formate/nitrite transporter family protein [Hyphomicrobiaceae bacterium]
MADTSTKGSPADDQNEPVTAPHKAATSSGLSYDEKRHVREAAAPRAAVVYEIIRTKGDMELRRPISALWWSGVAAGISIGLSFLTEAAIAAHLPAGEASALVAKLGYAVGFLVVILGHQQLFTENVLTAVLPVISRRSFKWLKRMLRLWILVLAANLVGCTIFALFLAKLPIVDASVAKALGDIVKHLMANTPYEMFVKGIGAGWMIAALVWILSASEGSDFLIITLITYLIALFGLTHIVAGSAEAIYGVLTGLIDLEKAVYGFFLPTLSGNVVGGTVLFSVLSYAQVREEIYLADHGN